MTIKKYPIIPVPKPRQTRADKYKKRPPVLRYRAFADECRLRKVHVPLYGAHITFVLPMPKGWSDKKKIDMNQMPHQQKPDVDNLAKALFDAVYSDDSKIWDARITKIWGFEGEIIIDSGCT